MPLVAINRFAWNTITEERLEGLIRSTPARMQAVIDSDPILASTMVEVYKIENKACKIGALQMGPRLFVLTVVRSFNITHIVQPVLGLMLATRTDLLFRRWAPTYV